MNKEIANIIKNLDRAEKLASSAVIEQVRKLTQVNIKTQEDLKALVNAYNVLKSYYEGMPLEKELEAVTEKLSKNIDEISKSLKSQTLDEIKSVGNEVKELKKEIKRVEKSKPKELTQIITERIQEIPREISLDDKKQILDESLKEDNVSKLIEAINELPITGDKQIDASHIKNLPDFENRLRSIGVSNKYLSQLLDVDLSGLTYTNGKYVLGSGTGGGGGSSFNDQTPNTDASYGTLAGDVDGANTTFTVSEGEYLTGKLKVYLNGQLQEQNSTGDWVETTPASGTFDFLVAPTIGDTVTASYETVASSGGIQSVVAGTNVTVDNTDPLNPIVSATGGGGGGSGDVVGPASATDNAIARFDTTTGKLIQNSVVTIADTSGNMAGVGTLNTHTIPGGTGTIALTSDLHSAVTVTDSSEINFTLTGQDITASLIAGSIDETKLDASVNASLDLADSASQPGHTHTLANITDVTASVAEVNVLDGVTSTTAELNILDGVTATASEINVLDGITATVTELNYTDGVTSAIQTQLNGKATLSQTTSNTWNFQGTTADGDYILTLKAGFAMTITETTTKCTSGTGTATFKINTTALGGTANSVSSSEQSQSHASANSVSAGDDIVVTISSASALTNMVISILATRTLA